MMMISSLLRRRSSLLHALRAALFIALMIGLQPVSASAAVVPDCEAMAARVGAAAGLPAGLLPAISRIESGRRVGKAVRAWPWTLNHAGKGLYFETRAEALDYLKKTVAEGPRNIDVGCMQVNNYWHGKNFPSLDAMLDPETNIRYAVRFLKELYEQEGSWEEAVKHYHSPDPDRGARYHRAFQTARAAIDPEALGRSDVMAVDRATTITKREAMMAGGLFGQALPVSAYAVAPYGATESAYAALLDLLAERDRGALTFVPVTAQLAESSRSPMLRQNWKRVEEFRRMLAEAP
jgi:hypothetical protein